MNVSPVLTLLLTLVQSPPKRVVVFSLLTLALCHFVQTNVRFVRACYIFIDFMVHQGFCMESLMKSETHPYKPIKHQMEVFPYTTYIYYYSLIIKINH